MSLTGISNRPQYSCSDLLPLSPFGQLLHAPGCANSGWLSYFVSVFDGIWG